MSVIVHTKATCIFCDKAKAFLTDKKIPYEEVFYDPTNPDYEIKKNALVGRTHHYTFPQIFVGGTFVGGFAELTHAYDTLLLHELCSKIGLEVEMEF